MTDGSVRELERRLREEGRLPSLEERMWLRKNGGSADFDPSIPHRFEVVEGKTYALAQAALRDPRYETGLQPFYDGLPRFLTADELMRARVEEIETGESLLWDNWHFTSSGIATCAKDDSRFKIVRMSPEFLYLRTRATKRIVRKPKVIVDYDAIEGVELRVQDAQYGCQYLEEDDMVEHQFWQRLLQPDGKQFSDQNKETLAKYARKAIELEERQRTDGGHGVAMCVFLGGGEVGRKKDYLRAVTIGQRTPHNVSVCIGGEELDIYTYSVRVCPR